jgi:thiamine pyrophosphokinase
LTKRAVVISNGEIRDLTLIRTRLAAWGEALCIAADGGSRYAIALGLNLDAVIGDLDSIDELSRTIVETSGVPLIISPTNKNETDLELAVLYAVHQGAQSIALLGTLGGRADMTLANMHLLLHPELNGIRVEVWNGGQTAWLIAPPGEDIQGEVGDTVSLLPLRGDAEGVTTTNLEYPLNNEELQLGIARGVSNVMTTTHARVDIRSGILFVVHSPGKA